MRILVPVDSRFGQIFSLLGQSKFPVKRASGIHRQDLDSIGRFRGQTAAEQGKSTKFPVSFPSNENLRLLQPCAVTVDMVRGEREAWTVAADNGLEGLVEAAVVGIGGGEALARRRDAVAQPAEVDS